MTKRIFTGNLTRILANDTRVTLHHGDQIPAGADAEQVARLDRMGVLGVAGEPAAEPVIEQDGVEVVDDPLEADAIAARAAAEEAEKLATPAAPTTPPAPPADQSAGHVIDPVVYELDDVIAHLERTTPNGDDTIALAGDDPAYAAVLIEAEKATRNRSTVIVKLEKLATPAA